MTKHWIVENQNIKFTFEYDGHIIHGIANKLAFGQDYYGQIVNLGLTNIKTFKQEQIKWTVPFAGTVKIEGKNPFKEQE